jgi:hypothetical protein
VLEIWGAGSHAGYEQSNLQCGHCSIRKGSFQLPETIHVEQEEKKVFFINWLACQWKQPVLKKAIVRTSIFHYV